MQNVKVEYFSYLQEFSRSSNTDDSPQIFHTADIFYGPFPYHLHTKPTVCCSALGLSPRIVAYTTQNRFEESNFRLSSNVGTQKKEEEEEEKAWETMRI